MGRPKKRSAIASAQRRQTAAINVAALGLAFIVLPHLLGNSLIAAILRPLAPIGWLLLVAGGILSAFLLRQKTTASGAEPMAGATSQPVARTPQRPSHPVPLVKRIEPVTPSAHVAGNAPGVRPQTWGPNVFAVIEWRRFEAVVEALFAQAGFLTKAESHGPDGGVDVWLYSKNQPDGEPVSIVQCKHWQGKRVGVDKVRELRGVMAANGVSRGQFATTSSFTADAASFGAANGIKLHDGAGLLGLIAKRTPAQQQALLDVALEGDYWRPTCVNCGIKMTEKVPQAGGDAFWGCVNFPKCRATMKMRTA